MVMRSRRKDHQRHCPWCRRWGGGGSRPGLQDDVNSRRVPTLCFASHAGRDRRQAALVPSLAVSTSPRALLVVKLNQLLTFSGTQGWVSCFAFLQPFTTLWDL